MENIIEKAKQIHEDNVKKGFWDNETPESRTTECLALIHSEVSETLESFRKNKWADIEQFEDDQKSWIADFRKDFKANIKDTVEDELADTAIRILDLIGAWKFNYTDDEIYDCSISNDKSDISDNVPEAITFIHHKITFTYRGFQISDNFKLFLLELYFLIEEWSKKLEIDLDKHIELKLEYNRSREYKHGKML